MFVRDKLEAAGGVKQPLVEFAAAESGLRVMDGRFMAIQQAMGMPKGRSQAHAYLQTFIEEMKASGFCAQALKRSNQPDAVVAPPAERDPEKCEAVFGQDHAQKRRLISAFRERIGFARRQGAGRTASV